MENPQKRANLAQTHVAQQQNTLRNPQQTLVVHASRKQSFADYLPGATPLNTVTVELKQRTHIPAGATVQVASVQAASLGAGDVIEVPAEISASIRVGYYLRHLPVNGSLVYSNTRCLNPSDADVTGFSPETTPYVRGRTHCMHVLTPTAVSGGTAVTAHTPPSKAHNILPKLVDGNKNYFVPAMSQSSAALGCAKLLPLTAGDLPPNGGSANTPNARFLGYRQSGTGFGIVAQSDLSGDTTRLRPFFKRITLTVPPGNYSPTDIVTILNRQLQQATASLGANAVQPLTVPGYEMQYPMHNPLAVQYRSPLQLWTDELPTDTFLMGLVEGEQHDTALNGHVQQIRHWHATKNLPKKTTVEDQAIADAFRSRPVVLGKDESYFEPFLIGGQAEFDFDAENSRFVLKNLHQGFTQSDFTETAYPAEQTVDAGGKAEVNRISIAAQAALGADYCRENGPFDGESFASPQQVDGTDGMGVAGMHDPSWPYAEVLTHYNGAFILSWWENEHELEFWETLGFVNEQIIEGNPYDTLLPPNSTASADATKLFSWLRSNKTDAKIDSSIFFGRQANYLGNTNYETPFGQTVPLQNRINDIRDIAAFDTNYNNNDNWLPLSRLDGGFIPITSWLSAFNRLFSVIYWHFAPPMFKRNTTSFLPESENLPAAAQTRFVVSVTNDEIRAKNLPRKLQIPQLILTTSLPVAPATQTVLTTGESITAIATLAKTFEQGDFFSGQEPGPPCVISADTTLSRIHFDLLNPDGTPATNLSGSIFIKLLLTIPPSLEQQQQDEQQSHQPRPHGQA